MPTQCNAAAASTAVVLALLMSAAVPTAGAPASLQYQSNPLVSCESLAAVPLGANTSILSATTNNTRGTRQTMAHLVGCAIGGALGALWVCSRCARGRTAHQRRGARACRTRSGRGRRAAAARRLAVTTAPFQPAACDIRVAAYAESACAAAASALAEGREEEALAAADAALMARPDLARAWSLRAKSLNACGLFVDMLASVPHMRAVDAAWEDDAAVAQSSLQSLFEALVLIVDLWHPELETDEQRSDALNDEAQRERYRGAALRGEYETTSLRGH